MTQVITPPDGPLLTAAQYKTALRISHAAYDNEIAFFTSSAEEFVERAIGRKILRQTLRETQLAWVDRQASPVCSGGYTSQWLFNGAEEVTEIKYFDSDNAEQVLPATNYQYRQPHDGVVELMYKGTLPVRYSGSYVTIDYTAGWENAESVPGIIQALCTLVMGSFLEHKESDIVNATVSQTKLFEQAVNTYKVRLP